MNSLTIISVIVLYFIVLLIISFLTSKSNSNSAFFSGNKTSPWYLVAFGMIGTSLSGITFISIPGWVGSTQFSYMQMVMGYMLGYFIIATVLMPLYYKMNLTSIYGYFETRFGVRSYKTGAAYFLLSRTIGAAFRLYLVAMVLSNFVFKQWDIPFSIIVGITILLIWLYTFRGGIRTIVFTDTLQTLFMLVGVGLVIFLIKEELQLSFAELTNTISNSAYSKVFFFDDWNSKQHFIKQFSSGTFIAIVMTGMDQDMMQKNLSCKNINEAKKNMFWFSGILLVVNFVFLALGALLYIYAQQKGIEIPDKTDQLFPLIALEYLGPFAGIVFILGLIAAAYSSADSALTALTTSFCIDFLGVKKSQSIKKRYMVHIGFSILLFFTILIFESINNDAVISQLFKIAGYTYGPLLGLFSFGIIMKQKVKDKYVPIVCILSPIICYILSDNSIQWFNGYQFGFELLMLNGIITFFGLLIVSKKQSIKQ